MGCFPFVWCCWAFNFFHLIKDSLFWIFQGVRYFCFFYFFVDNMSITWQKLFKTTICTLGAYCCMIDDLVIWNWWIVVSLAIIIISILFPYFFHFRRFESFILDVLCQINYPHFEIDNEINSWWFISILYIKKKWLQLPTIKMVIYGLNLLIITIPFECQNFWFKERKHIINVSFHIFGMK